MTTSANAFQDQSIPDLIKAVQAADTVALEQLFVKGADLNVRTPSGMTALMCAAANGYAEIVSQLLTRGADINIAMNEGVTALTLAASYGHHQTVRDLIASGAHVTAIGKLGVSPETWANEHGFIEVAELLGQASKVADVEEDDEPKEVCEGLEAEADIHAVAVANPEWIEIPDSNEISPASIWALEDDDEITVIRNAGALNREIHSLVPDGTDLMLEGKHLTHPLPLGGTDLALGGTDLSQGSTDLTVGGADSAILPEAENEETLTGMTPDEDLIFYPASFIPDVSSLNEQLDVPDGPPASALEIEEQESRSTKQVHCAGLLDESFGPVQVEQAPKPKTNVTNRPRILDDSYILPGEASFATVMLNQNAPHRYSPVSEFLIKFGSNARLIVVTLLVVIGSTVATLAFLNSDSLRTVLSSASSAVRQKSFFPQAEPVSTPKKTTTAGGEIKAETPSPAVNLKAGTVTKTSETPAPKEKVTKSIKDDRSKIASASSRGKPDSGKAQPVAYKERETLARTSKSTSAKKPAASSKTGGTSTGVKNSTSARAKKEISKAEERRELGSTADARPSPTTNGSQRPRRVAPRPDSP